MCFRVGFGFADAAFISNQTHFLWCQCHPLLIYWIYFDMFQILTMSLFGYHIYCRMIITTLAFCDECTPAASAWSSQWSSSHPCGCLHSPTGLKSMETESCCGSISAVHWWQIADSWCPTQVYIDYCYYLGCQCRVWWFLCCFHPDSRNKILGERLNVSNVKVPSLL